MTSALYERLIERDLDAIAPAARAFDSPDELFLAVARFAVLAYAPSQHAKRAVMCCRAAHELREGMGERWTDLLVECARYTAESRQPWSEPPFLEPPEPSDEDLGTALASGDRLRAERWLSAHLEDPDLEQSLRAVAHGDALLMTDTAFALLPILGEKGKFALLRMPIWEMVTDPDARDPSGSLEELVARAVESKGAIDAVQAVFVYAAGHPSDASREVPAPPVYHLARDYGQTLIAHAVASRLAFPPQAFLDAVHHNLRHGDNFAEWSFA